MPGLVGFTDRHNRYGKNMLADMRRCLKHSDKYIDDDLFVDKILYGSRTHLEVVDQGKQPCVLNSCFCSWLEGEFYNQEDLSAEIVAEAENDNSLFVHLYQKAGTFDFLSCIDGNYAAVIYDKAENKIHLISDRYGFKFLYWGIINGDLVWASELKGFLAHAGFKPRIDRQ